LNQVSRTRLPAVWPSPQWLVQEFREPHQFVDLIARAVPLGELVARVARQIGADAAQRAKAAPFMVEEMGEIARDLAQIAIFAEDFVTLLCREREVSAGQELSARCDRRPPHGHRRSAKHAVRLG
jgi:hypothetical protein